MRAWQRLPPESSLKRGPFRGLHAAWSVLLSYEWLSYSGLADRVIIGDEPESVTGLLKKKQRCSFNLTNELFCLITNRFTHLLTHQFVVTITMYFLYMEIKVINKK